VNDDFKKPIAPVEDDEISVGGNERGGESVDSGSGYTDSGGTREDELSFAGLESVSDITGSSLRLHWNAHDEAEAYVLYNKSSGSPKFLTSVNAPATS
jgi:hypothetical protein